MKVELIYEKSCPNIALARDQLLHAFVDAGVAAKWQEWEVSDPDAPSYIHGYGSPTILVNGHDVAGDESDKDDNCCRVYSSNGDSNDKGVPFLNDIVDSIRSATASEAGPKTRAASRWQMNSTLLPVVGTALLPKLACPACWPAYAGLLSSLGIGFIDYTPLLLPLTSLFLLITLIALFYRAKYRRGYQPFYLGVAASAAIVIGKFQYDNDTAMYVGLGLLILSSVWNTWPKSHIARGVCPACEPQAVTEGVNTKT
jgi:hypothetical protein